MNYSEVFNKAWKYVWKHKILWLFALFAGSLVGVSINFPGNPSGNGIQYRYGREDWLERVPSFLRGHVPDLWQDMRSASPWMWAWVVIALLVVVLLLTAINLFLGTAGRGGLIKGLLLAEDRFDDKPLHFKEVWQAMKPYFWRLLLLRLLVGLALMLIGAILAVSIVLITIGTLGLALCLIIPLAVLGIPIGWLVKAIIANASIVLVDENLGVFKSIARSWQIVTNNVWSVLLVMFFNLLISIGTVLAVLFPIILVTAPFFLTGLLGGELSTGLWVVLGILLVVAIVLAFFIGMWANTLIHGVFVLAYRRFKSQVTTPFGRTGLATPLANSEADKMDTVVEVNEPKQKNSTITSGLEPASNELDEDSHAG